MASPQLSPFLSVSLCFLLPLLFTISHCSNSQIHRPTALVLPVSKQASSTLQYVTRITQTTPKILIDVVLDLTGPFLWVSCDYSCHNSSTYKAAKCHSTQCLLAHDSKGCSRCVNGSRPLCSSSDGNNNTCILFSENVITSRVSSMYLGEDAISLPSTDGVNPTSPVSIPRFLFLRAAEFLWQGLAGEARGVAGLGHGRIGMPTQLAAAFNLSRKFGLCLPPSKDYDGVVFFGDGPYVFLPGIDVSKLLIFTPLILRNRTKASRNSTHHHLPSSSSHEYYIRVKYIRMNGEKLPVNPSLFSINRRGIGGTKISTVHPYSVLQTSIYSSVTEIFIQEAEAANVTRVAPVAPFDVCFSTLTPSSSGLVRPPMPVIDLMLQNEEVFWRIFETNSMVPVGNDTVCLGFMDGGPSPKASIVIGGYQLEDNFLQFDLESSSLGFTSSLLLRETSCSYFNFTSNVVVAV